MSLWAKTQLLKGAPLEQIRSMYSQCFPIDVRHFCAEWIESQAWDSIDVFNQNHEKMASGILSNLIREIESKTERVDDFITKVKLNDAATSLRDQYHVNPLGLIQMVKQLLDMEKQLVLHAEDPTMPAPQLPGMGDAQHEFILKFEIIQRRNAEIDNDLKKLREAQESFVIVYHEKYQIDDAVTKTPEGPTLTKLKQKKQLVDATLNEKATEILSMRTDLANKLFQSINELSDIQNLVLNDHLMGWRRQQQVSGNGTNFYNNLDQIQQFCENLAENIWQCRQQLQLITQLRTQLPIPMESAQDLHPVLTQKITDLLSALVTSTFIVDRQPPQVMKVSNKFTCSVRLLVGSKLNVYMTNPQVVGTIISESQARQLIQGDKTANNATSGVIVNNSGRMEYNQANRQLVVNFRNMALKTVKRSEKRKHQEAVTEEKFCLLFQSKFTVANELAFSVWTLSLPTVVIVHGSQEAQATAVILWDNAFAPPGRMPFDVPKDVAWPMMAEQLNAKFKSMVGVGLTQEHLYFLASKLFGVCDDYSRLRLSRNKFHKENLPERKFTFWEWFYDAMKLTKEHLQDLWNAGLVHGFLSKNSAQELLLSKSVGTFLLRFSDSILGGITIAWVNDDSGQAEVLSIQPYTHKDFAIRSCADRVFDLSASLIYLFPDIPRDSAFGKFYGNSPLPETQRHGNTDYVPSHLQTTIVGIAASSRGGSQTPVHPKIGETSPESPSNSSYGAGPLSVNSAGTEVSNMSNIDDNSMNWTMNDDDMNGSFAQGNEGTISESDLYNILSFSQPQN